MASTHLATRSHKGAGFLFFLGFVLLATGVGFATAPHYSWQVQKVAQAASALGLEHGLLALGGLLFLGLGVAARSGAAPAPVVETRNDEQIQAEIQLVNEQLSTKIAQLRTALLQIHESVTAVSTQQQAQLQGQGEQTGSSDHSQDAVFRLAASLDKLHAHLDERVHAVDLQLRSGFESLLQASHEVRRLLGSHAGAAVHAHAAVHPAAHSGAHAAHAEPHAQGAETGIDFYETMQKLDAISGEPGHGPGQAGRSGGQPQAPFPSSAHGDALDALLPEEYRDRY